MQSYQNVSNSQLSLIFRHQCRSCKRLCKVIKMLAIHNDMALRHFILLVANAFAKLSKCQQFTTLSSSVLQFAKLQTLLQSYQNVSNSQLSQTFYFYRYCCKRFCKVIKMLAIHNFSLHSNDIDIVANAYAKLSKCQQFTTSNRSLAAVERLQTLLQSYQNVSNSQLI